MSDRRSEELRFAEAVRGCMPEAAPAGTADRLGAALRSTPQRRPLPSIIAPLFDAEPVGRRSALLVVAIVLLAMALAGAIAAGGIRLWAPPTPDDTVKPPPDVQAYMVSVVQDSPVVRPMKFTVVDDQFEYWSGETASQPVIQRVYMNEAGAVRIERFVSAESAEPDSIAIITRDRYVELTRQAGDEVWVEEVGPHAPREWVRTAAYLGIAERGCEMVEPDPSTNWEYVGLEEILGRPVHHLRCDGDFWVDTETRLVLRSSHTEETTHTVEVTALELAPQPASLFDTTAPEGIRTVRRNEQRDYEVREYEARVCAVDPVCSAPEVPLITPPPASGAPEPLDVGAIVARARAAQANVPSMQLTVSRWRSKGGDAGRVHLDYDAPARYRIEWGADPLAGTPGHAGIVASAEEIYRSETADDGTVTWRRLSGSRNLGVARDMWLWDVLLNQLPQECPSGWRHLGVDLVHEFTADHVTCDGVHYWIDRESGLVVRLQAGDARDVNVSEVVNLSLGRSPDARFALPDGAVFVAEPTPDPAFTPSPPPEPSG